MFKILFKILTVMLLVAVLFGAADPLVAEFSASSDDSESGFAASPSLGVVGAVSAEGTCPDGHPGC